MQIKELSKSEWEELFYRAVKNMPKTDAELKKKYEREIELIQSDLDDARSFIAQLGGKGIELFDLRMECKKQRRQLLKNHSELMKSYNSLEEINGLIKAKQIELDELERQIRLARAEYETL